MSQKRVLYNASDDCHTANCCPMIEQEEGGAIVIHDPAKPENGRYTMTAQELRDLLGQAPDILSKLSA